MFIFLIYVGLMSSRDALHPVTDHGADIPLDVSRVFAVLQLPEYLQSRLRPKFKRRTQLGPDLLFRGGRLCSRVAGRQQRENQKQEQSCSPACFHLQPNSK